jgi:nucleoside-diphosphate-sugar epimerase
MPYWIANLLAISAEGIAKLTRKKERPILTKAELEFLTILEQHCDISRGKSELGWQPKVGLAEGIQATAEWAKAYLGQKGLISAPTQGVSQ